MISKPAILRVCLILAIINVVLIGEAAARGHHLNGGRKAKLVNLLCQSSNYKDVCIRTLKAVRGADPKELIKGAVIATQEAVKRANNYTESQLAAASEERAKHRYDHCKQQFDFARQDLQEFMDIIGNDNNNLDLNFYDLRQKLLGAFVNRSNCLLVFMDSEDLETLMDNNTIQYKEQINVALDAMVAYQDNRMGPIKGE